MGRNCDFNISKSSLKFFKCCHFSRKMHSWEFRFLNAFKLVTQIRLIDQKKASWFKNDFCVNYASYTASYTIDDRPFCLQNFALLSMFVLCLFCLLQASCQFYLKVNQMNTICIASKHHHPPSWQVTDLSIMRAK